MKLCECGCGVQVGVAKWTCRSKGWTKGQPKRFIHGHNKGHTTHGHTHSGTYSTWTAMIGRCSIPTLPHYARYGGRGIRVCDRWMTFENFLADMGERPSGMSIDRINNDGDYEPGNCRWATPQEQRANRRPCKPYKWKRNRNDFDGRKL